MTGKPLAARGLAGLWLLWFVAGLLPAWFSFRYLYADGAAYLIEIIHRHFFFFPWNGRQAAQVLDQWPAVLAVLAGVRNIRCIAGSLGAGMMFMPVLIHGLALGLLLRRGRGGAAAVYLAMLWLLQLYAGGVTLDVRRIAGHQQCQKADHRGDDCGSVPSDRRTLHPRRQVLIVVVFRHG